MKTRTAHFHIAESRIYGIGGSTAVGQHSTTAGADSQDGDLPSAEGTEKTRSKRFQTSAAGLSFCETSLMKEFRRLISVRLLLSFRRGAGRFG